MLSLDVQVQAFLVTVAAGAVTGLLFDFYRIGRGIARPGWFLTGLGDLLFWFVAVVVVFSFLVYGSWGEVRLYVFIGLALGTWLYYRLVSRLVLRLLLAVLHFCRLLLHRLTNLVRFVTLGPYRWLRRLLLAVGRVIGLPFQPLRRWSRAVTAAGREKLSAWYERRKK